MVEDISRRTVLILVILTLLVSTLSTFAVLNVIGSSNVDQASYVHTGGSQAASGRVHLTIDNQQPATSSGKVQLNIDNNNLN